MRRDEYQRMYEAEDCHWWFVATRRLIGYFARRHLRNSSRARILDAGCGTGATLGMLAGMGTAFGSDFSKDAVAFSRSRGLSNIVRSRIEQLPYQPGCFTIVVCADVLYHQWIADDLCALQELWRVLEPGGTLIVQVAAFEFLRGSHDEVVFTRHRYTRQELAAKLRLAGFAVRHVTCRNVLLVPVLAMMRLLSGDDGEKARSNVRALHPWLNRIILLIVSLESLLVRHIGIPVGASVFAAAVKPPEPG